MASKLQLRQWARIGAAARLREINSERTEILRLFPGINVSTGGVGRQRSKLSDAARRKLSAGMRKYWARRKAAEAVKKR